MKTQTRIALTFFLVTLTLMVVLGSGVYFFVIKYTFNDFYKRLETRAVLAARIRLENEPASATAFQEMRDRILEKLPQEEDYFFEITPGKDFQQESQSLKLPVNFFDEIARGKTSRYQKGQIFFSGILYRQDKRSFIVIVSAENYYYSHHLTNLRSIMGIAIVVVALLVLSVSIWFSRYVFLPVRQITNQVKDINSQNLHLRLQASSVHDDELKNTFNTMLDRLETSFATQNNFISNASHELGTPLTAIIGEADVALSKTRSHEEYRETIGIILNEAERLERITKSLLFLAQTGFDGKKVKMEIVRVDQLVWDVKETIEKMNPKNKVNIDLSLMPDNHLKLKIKGNSQLLHLAISNIVSNGCKYSSHQPVKLSIGSTDDSVIVVVQDTGIGIPPSEMAYIYDPFYRASNTHNFEGYGIGLPLARNIMRQHRATIVVTSAVNEGTTVRLTFPLENIGQH